MSKDYISVAFSINELQALHAALRDKISNLKSDHPFVKQYRHMLEGADLKIKLAANTVFGINEVLHPTMKKKPNLNTAIDVAYRTTIDLARETNSPVEFVCGTFNCGECRECNTCDTVRKAEEWECRYRDWKESNHADKNKR
jgi:hypothetical protein